MSLQLVRDRHTLAGDGCDAMPVTVQVLDAKGRLVPTSNLPVEFEISGPGFIIGLGNGNPNSHEAEKGNKRKLFNGLAQVILQSSFSGGGLLVLKANAEGLKSAEISIKVEKTAQIPSVELVSPTLILNNWRVSPLYKSNPEATQDIVENDMNTWTNIKPAKDNISVKFPAKEGVWKLTVVIEGKNGDQVGLGGIVST